MYLGLYSVQNGRRLFQTFVNFFVNIYIENLYVCAAHIVILSRFSRLHVRYNNNLILSLLQDKMIFLRSEVGHAYINYSLWFIEIESKENTITYYQQSIINLRNETRQSQPIRSLGDIHKLRHTLRGGGSRRSVTLCDKEGERSYIFWHHISKIVLRRYYTYKPNWNNSIENHWTLHIELNKYIRYNIQCSLSAIRCRANS